MSSLRSLEGVQFELGSFCQRPKLNLWVGHHKEIERQFCSDSRRGRNHLRSGGGKKKSVLASEQNQRTGKYGHYLRCGKLGWGCWPWRGVTEQEGATQHAQGKPQLRGPMVRITRWGITGTYLHMFQSFKRHDFLPLQLLTGTWETAGMMSSTVTRCRKTEKSCKDTLLHIWFVCVESRRTHSKDIAPFLIGKAGQHYMGKGNWSTWGKPAGKPEKLPAQGKH